MHCALSITQFPGSAQLTPWLLVHVQNFFWGGGGVASRVPWGWRDSYGKTGNFGRVGDKSMFKMYKNAEVGREGDI